MLCSLPSNKLLQLTISHVEINLPLPALHVAVDDVRVDIDQDIFLIGKASSLLRNGYQSVTESASA